MLLQPAGTSPLWADHISSGVARGAVPPGGGRQNPAKEFKKFI